MANDIGEKATGTSLHEWACYNLDLFKRKVNFFLDIEDFLLVR